MVTLPWHFKNIHHFISNFLN